MCSGGIREGERNLDGSVRLKGGGCRFEATEYVAAVNHATANGAVPPDMPRGLWA